MSLRNKSPYQKYKCEKCGYDDDRRALHTHHVKDVNNEVVGVITLCANCHYILHSNSLGDEFKEIEDFGSGRWFVYEEIKERYWELLLCLHNVLMERYIELGGKGPTISYNPRGLKIDEILDIKFTFKELDLLHDLLFQCEAELGKSRKFRD